MHNYGLHNSEKDVDRVDRIQRRAAKLVKGLEDLPCEKRMRVKYFLPGEEKAWEALITVVYYLKGGYNEGGCSLFTRRHMEKTRGNRYKLHRDMVRLDERTKCSTVRTADLRSNIHRDVVEPSLLEVFRMQ